MARLLVVGEGAARASSYPGHEPAGDAVAVGEAVRDVQVGDHVALHLSSGACAASRAWRAKSSGVLNERSWRSTSTAAAPTSCWRPDANCLSLPGELSHEAGALTVDNFGTQYHTEKRLGASGMSAAAIIGIGPMGAAGIRCAKVGCAQVIAVDVLDHRLVLDERLGADHLLRATGRSARDEFLSLTRGPGVEVANDCSGNVAGQTLALNAGTKLGEVAFVGEFPTLTVSPSEQFLRKELEVIGARVWPIFEFDEIVRFLLLHHQVSIESTVSDHCGLSQAPDAFSRFERRLNEKVVFVWDGDPVMEAGRHPHSPSI